MSYLRFHSNLRGFSELTQPGNEALYIHGKLTGVNIIFAYMLLSLCDMIAQSIEPGIHQVNG